MGTTIDIESNSQLERLLTTNPQMEKQVQKIIRTVLLQARRIVSERIKSGLTNDPKQAYKAVKTAVYRNLLGGNMSILNRRRRGARLPESPVYHALERRTNGKGNHRGGNRMPRSQRTSDLMTYAGADRGFILRFLNSGTEMRHSRIGNRGAIAPRGFFADSSQRAMEQAAEQLDTLINKLIEKELN